MASCPLFCLWLARPLQMYLLMLCPCHSFLMYSSKSEKGVVLPVECYRVTNNRQILYSNIIKAGIVSKYIWTVLYQLFKSVSSSHYCNETNVNISSIRICRKLKTRNYLPCIIFYTLYKHLDNTNSKNLSQSTIYWQ